MIPTRPPISYSEAMRRMRLADLRRHGEGVVNLLAELLFAYKNKDENMPHNFEIDAVISACEFLLEHYKGNKYSKDFFKSVLEDMQKERDRWKR